MPGNTGGLRMSEIETRLTERMQAQPMVAACSLCSWRSEGAAGDVLAAQRAHRESEHGIKRLRSRKASRHLGSFRTPALTDDDRAEIAAEVDRRKRLLGIDA